MFKDSQVTRFDAWTILEESDAMPVLCYPAFVGTGKLGIGLDAAGLQSLTESLGEQYHCPVKPVHVTQADLYILREGMISAHLWDDEIEMTGVRPQAEHARREAMRNFLPLGWLDQEFELDADLISPGDAQQRTEHRRLQGSEIRELARSWRREWDLRAGVVCTSYELGHYQRFRVSLAAFAPHGSESVYLKLSRTALPGREGQVKWTVRLNLRTRHGLPIFDEPGSVKVGERTLLAKIDRPSRFNPAEPYAVVYGVAADGMTLKMAEDGWTATMDGPAAQEQTAWLRLDFRRHAGIEVPRAVVTRDSVEAELRAFKATDYDSARSRHAEDYAAFWSRTGDVEVADPDPFEVKRRLMLHLSEYLLRCGNEFAQGGTAQFLFLHQNGWRACSFHDHHFIVDGLARANLWAQAEDHARWMRRIMHGDGRPFPWMMTYDGFATVPPEVDRAPMSDANRALLAARLYELHGTGRDAFLRETVYPIVKAVADHGVERWFYEENGRMLFRPVENDVMHDVARVSEMATVMAYVTVLRKAIEYSERLGVDKDRRAEWRRVADAVRFETTPDGRYRAWLGAPDDTRGNDFFLTGLYIAEAGEYLDAETFRRSRDFGQRLSSCNFAWLNSMAAGCEIRLDRADRAEQYMVDTLEHTIHGPGYFEECVPNGISSLPPFATAHGSFVTAACEQVVLSDFWHDRVWVGRGLPSRLRTARLRFANLRARGGVMISGESDPRRLAVRLVHAGEPVTMEIVLRIPCSVGMRFRVERDGAPAEHAFQGESVAVRVELANGQTTGLAVVG